jgi:hypothetical protein
VLAFALDAPPLVLGDCEQLRQGLVAYKSGHGSTR